jgi:hypothetical protein
MYRRLNINEQIKEAYERQAEKIAYVAENVAGYTIDSKGFNNE